MTADHGRDPHPVLERVLDAAVAHVQALADVELEDPARLAALLGTLLGRAPAHVAGRHVDDAGGAATILELSQHAAGTDLGIVGVRTERQDIDGHRSLWGRGEEAGGTVDGGKPGL